MPRGEERALRGRTRRWRNALRRYEERDKRKHAFNIALKHAFFVYCIYMTRRKLEDKNIRSLSKTSGGSSYSITLPIDEVRDLKWRERQKLVVTRKGDKLIIEDWPTSARSSAGKKK